VAVWLNELKKQIPLSRLRTDAATLQSHSGDAWFASRQPQAVFFPQRTAEVSTVLRLASKYRIPVTARGAGRGYVGSAVPQRGGIVVSFAKMQRILEIHPVDGVAIVQPGVITEVLQNEVKKFRLFYPPDPASKKECFLGGNVATNAGGPRCLKYGVTKNYVLGLEVVLADGTVVRTGSRTHKNKTGFDLTGLFVGSEGMLGLTTEITLRLLPLPPARATLSASFADVKHAAATVLAIQQAGFLPSAMEIADSFTLEAARRHVGRDRVPPGRAHLLVELDGQKSSVAREIQILARLIKKQRVLQLVTADTETGNEALWALRREFSASLKASGLKKMNEDVTVPRSRLVDLFHLGEKLQKKYGHPVACFGHAGDGNIHVNIMLDPQDRAARRRGDLALDELFVHIIKWKGAITGEHGIGLAKLPWWKQATTPALRDLHKKIKLSLDPQHLLNPGKFI
jgi:glycolate oxidase